MGRPGASTGNARSDTEWTAKNLVNRVEPIASGDGWTEERTGLHESQFIETRRHWFTGTVHHDTAGNLNVLNLVARDPQRGLGVPRHDGHHLAGGEIQEAVGIRGVALDRDLEGIPVEIDASRTAGSGDGGTDGHKLSGDAYLPVGTTRTS